MEKQNWNIIWFLILVLSLCCVYIKNNWVEVKENFISQTASTLCHEVCMECVRAEFMYFKGSSREVCVEYKYTGKEICEPEMRKYFKSEFENNKINPSNYPDIHFLFIFL